MAPSSIRAPPRNRLGRPCVPAVKAKQSGLSRPRSGLDWRRASGAGPMTAAAKRQMHLGVFWLGTGNHSAGWRYEGAATSNCSWPVVMEGARTAERGKFDLFFISDAVVMDPGDHPSFISRFEPTTLIAALSTVTSRVGLGATTSTSFSEPYDVARTFSSVQHISAGRAAWNVVTSTHKAA